MYLSETASIMPWTSVEPIEVIDEGRAARLGYGNVLRKK